MNDPANWVKVPLECHQCGEHHAIYYDPETAHTTIGITCRCGKQITWSTP